MIIIERDTIKFYSGFIDLKGPQNESPTVYLHVPGLDEERWVESY